MPVSGSNGYRSGIVTLPNRVRIREMDSRTGMYPTISRTGDATRGGNLNIPEFDDTQTVIFSKGVNNLLFGSLLESGSARSLLPYATPNNPNGGISGAGNVIAGISDNYYMSDYKELAYKNQEEESDPENLGFFDDSRISLGDTQFYLTGTSELSLPGFSSRLHDKTQIQIDLSTSTSTTFGFTEKSQKGDQNTSSSTQDLTNIRQQLMVYWNNDEKRWEKIAFGHGPNTHSTGSAGSGKEFYTELGNLLDTAAVGFGPCVGTVASGSGTGNRPVYSEDVIKTLGKPTSIFGFPSHGKFHAKEGQTIKMSEYINKPFLLEKLHLKFDAKFEFANASSAGNTMFNLSYVRNDGSGDATDDVVNPRDIFVMPTFFIMRQQKLIAPTSFTRDIPFVASGNGYVNSILDNQVNSYKKYYNTVMLNTFSPAHTLKNGAFNLNFTLPGDFKLTSGSELTTFVDTDRDLVTFGQIALYCSSSTPMFDTTLYNKLPGDKIVMLVDKDHKTSDGNTFLASNTDTIPPLTGTFDLEFKSRVIPVLPPRFGEYLVFTTGSSSGGKIFSNLFHNWEGGRTLSKDIDYPSENSQRLILPKNLRSKSRGLVNNIPYFDKGTVSMQKASGYDADLPKPIQYPKAETIDLDSPYLLFPEDELVFGWQYPYGLDMNTQQPNSLSTSLNTMTLDGVSKLTMFGSQIKNNQEFHDTLNQPLTSEAVHEAIHHDNPVIDQYVINTREEFSGSYVDLHRDKEESLAAPKNGSNVTIESIISAGNSLPNSMQRFVRLTNDKQVFFDTLVPDPISLWEQLTSSGSTLQSNGLKAIGIGGGTHANSGSHGVSADWLRSFAYNNSLGRVDFSAQEVNLKDVIIYFSDGDTSGETYVNGNGDQFIDVYKNFNFLDPGHTGISGIARLGNSEFKKNIENNLMWLYGFGTGVSGSLEGSNRTTPASFRYQVNQRPKGFKYGILSTNPIGKANIFRYDKYGQFSDMLEQSHDTIFYNVVDKDASEAPVQINFVTEENVGVYKILDKQSVSANTFQSSNTNVFATSSLPYFDDDTVRNRSYSSATGDDVKTLVTIVRDEI